MKSHNINNEAINILKKKNRDEEIKKYGKQIFFRTIVQRNLKKYNRKTKHKLFFE